MRHGARAVRTRSVSPKSGADIIAFDLCAQIDSVAYPMAFPADLDETVNLVEKTGRRIVAERGDVRDFDRLKTVVANGVAELGRIDLCSPTPGSSRPRRSNGWKSRRSSTPST